MMYLELICPNCFGRVVVAFCYRVEPRVLNRCCRHKLCIGHIVSSTGVWHLYWSTAVTHTPLLLRVSWNRRMFGLGRTLRSSSSSPPAMGRDALSFLTIRYDLNLLQSAGQNSLLFFCFYLVRLVMIWGTALVAQYHLFVLFPDGSLIVSGYICTMGCMLYWLWNLEDSCSLRIIEP